MSRQRYQKSYPLEKWTYHKRSAYQSRKEKKVEMQFTVFTRDSQQTVDYHGVNA